VVPYGKDIPMDQFLKHFHAYNVVIVKQSGGAFNRGALLNAGFHYVAEHLQAVETFVMMNPEALLNIDFAQRYFGDDGKDFVDFGHDLGMPFGWAFKCSKECFLKINGFPNTVAGTSTGMRAFENRVRALGIPVYTPTAKSMAARPKEGHEAKEDDGRAAIVADSLQRSFNGVNTLQYTVLDVQTEKASVRTLNVRLVPDVDLGVPDVDLGVADVDSGVSDAKLKGGSDEDDEEDDDEFSKGGSDEGERGDPTHLKTMELAYVHPVHPVVGGNVVNILDDAEVPVAEKLPFLHSDDVLTDTPQSDVKTININL